MAAFVFVSGAWHASSCWERVVPLLQEQGQRVVAPDLAELGASPLPLPAAPLEAWADQVAGVVREQEEPVISVGHSRGGIVISEAAERVSGSIATLVYLAAFLVPSGETLSGNSARVSRENPENILIPQSDGTTLVRRDAIGPTFYTMTEPRWVEPAIWSLSPEPASIFTTPLVLTDGGFGSVKRAYIECLEDKAVPLELQRMIRAALPCAPVFSLETDHSPFFSSPDQLAACLHEIACGEDRAVETAR